MVGADDQQGRVAGERILGNHAGARLNISLVEVADGRAHGSRVGGVEAIDRIRNIEGDGTVGGDEFEGFLCVFFVYLRFIGQAYRHELSLVSFGVEFFAGELAEPACQCGIDAAANAEHESVGAGCFRVVAEELYAPLYFLTRLLFGHIGTNTHLCHDFFLKFTHISSVRGRRLAEGTKDNADTLKISSNLLL